MVNNPTIDYKKAHILACKDGRAYIFFGFLENKNMPNVKLNV